MEVEDTRIKVQTSITKHAFFDLSHVSPLVFLYLLKECYAYGSIDNPICEMTIFQQYSCSFIYYAVFVLLLSGSCALELAGTCKATAKFRALQQQLYLVLINNSYNGPSVLIAHCLFLLPIFESYCDGFSHLVLSGLRRFLKVANNDEDLPKAKVCAARLFLDGIIGDLAFDEGILIKIVQIFYVNLSDIDKLMCDLSMKRNHKVDTAKEVVEQYVRKLMESQSYMTAVDLMIHFSIGQSGESFLLKLMELREYKAAEKWATYMGKPMLCLLVQEYVNRKLLKPAYDIIKKNNLCQEFPEVYHQGKESSLKRLAEKGVWEIAEARTKGDRQLLEYLVYLAMEAGYSEKVEELCDRYSLEGFLSLKEPESGPLHGRYLNLHELSIEHISWVDEVNGLLEAITHFEGCKVVGLDCEWKPNYEKGSKPSKVSIMQIASEKKVFIFDLIKLYVDVPHVLDECLACIFHSPSILKLGYNFQCDVRQLVQSYGELNCFKHFEMLLDIQNLYKEQRGGLSGLTEKILGAGLNKTRRNSNWEQRPLSQHQLEYAALDAVVLLHIFGHVSSSSSSSSSHSHSRSPLTNIEWKSHIVPHLKS